MSEELEKIDSTVIEYPQPEGIALDRETLAKYLPKGATRRLKDEVFEMLNNVEEDTGMSQELFSEQLCSYGHLITGGAGVEKLANAIKFVNLRQLPKMGAAKAYRVVFPRKTAEIEGRGQSVDSFASMYASTKMVTEVQKLMIMPTHITHRPMHNAMLQKLFNLTNGIGAKEGDYVSPTVQMNAAVELMNVTKMPEDNSMELKIGMSEEAVSVQQGLMAQLAKATDAQMASLAAGKSIKEVQRLGVNVDDIIEGEVDE